MAEPIFTDFGDEQSRRDYLTNKFDDLLQGINNQYGRELMEELLNRLEQTISIFHKDLQSLIDGLKKSDSAAGIKPKPKAQPIKSSSAKISENKNINEEKEITAQEQHLKEKSL